jgi:hypothetical protein
MDTSSKEHIHQFNSFMETIDGFMETSKNQDLIYDDIHQLMTLLMNGFKELKMMNRSDWISFCKVLRKLAHLSSQSPMYRQYSGRMMKFHDYIEKEMGISRRDKQVGSYGVPCMNMRTGMIYISTL